MGVIDYIIFLLVGVIYHLQVTEKYYDKLKSMNIPVAYLYVVGGVLFFQSAILIDMFRFFKKKLIKER